MLRITKLVVYLPMSLKKVEEPLGERRCVEGTLLPISSFGASSLHRPINDTWLTKIGEGSGSKGSCPYLSQRLHFPRSALPILGSSRVQGAWLISHPGNSAPSTHGKSLLIIPLPAINTLINGNGIMSMALTAVTTWGRCTAISPVLWPTA